MSETGAASIDAPSRGMRLPDLFRVFARSLALGFNVCEPARVTAWYPNLGRVDVTTEILTVVRGNTPATADVETPLTPIPLSRIPVIGVSVGGQLGRVSIPISVGDRGIAFYADRSLEGYKTAGVVDGPVGSRAHGKADGLFVHGLLVDASPLVPPPDPAALELEAIAIKLGALAVEPAVLGLRLQEALQTFATTVATANTTWGGNPVTGLAFSTALGASLVDLAASLGQILSTKVRVE